MRAIVLLPHAKITDEQLSQALHYGATTLGLDTDFDGCMRLVTELTSVRPIYLLNSGTPFGSRAEDDRLEAIQDLGWEVPDWIVVPVGNAGTSRRSARAPRVARAGDHRKEAPPRGDPGGRRRPVLPVVRDRLPPAGHARRGGDGGLGHPDRSPVSHPKAEREIRFFDGVVERVSEAELLEAEPSRTETASPSARTPPCPRRRRETAPRRCHPEGHLVVVVATAHA